MLQFVVDLFASDPFLGYTALAALFLGLISLISGWFKLDFLVLFKPIALFQLVLAVLVASLITLGQRLFAPAEVNLTFPTEALRGLSHLPLYLVTLGYGPSVGLVAGGLFAAFANTSGTLGWAEAVLVLELVVLGWLAIAPSPFKVRWAGTLNALLAYFLAWATGGSAYLQATTQQGMLFHSHINYHLPIVPGIILSACFLLFVGPKLYRQAFKDSHIAYENSVSSRPKSLVIPLQDLQQREKLRQRGKLTELRFDPLEFHKRRTRS